MDTSFYMSGLVNLGGTHRAFFETLGLSTPPVMTMRQLQNLLREAEGALSVMMFDPDSDQVAEWLTRQILNDLVDQFFPGLAARILANTGAGPRLTR